MSQDKTCVTGKRRYDNAAQARRACSSLGHTVRVYRCGHCRGVHVTKRGR